MPYGVAPNFVINGRKYVIPMVVEESSVVAAASLVAKYWSTRGGFKARVISTTKIGQVHFTYKGGKQELTEYFNAVKERLREATSSITSNMEKRGGGILAIELIDKTDDLPSYYQLHITFETVDSMGANFINSCLETIAKTFENDRIEVIMSILSNYVPECLVRAEVSCDVENLGGENPQKFAEKFCRAVQIAEVEPYRAVTHNKGIMNGIDAVVLATGNDFRAVEAGAHAYASTNWTIQKFDSLFNHKWGVFFLDRNSSGTGDCGWINVFTSDGKIILGFIAKPSAKELMMIAATAGLAQNFAALRALTTKGIQHGHMKMHLMNILNQLGASDTEKIEIASYFNGKTVTYSDVVNRFNEYRKTK